MWQNIGLGYNVLNMNSITVAISRDLFRYYWLHNPSYMVGWIIWFIPCLFFTNFSRALQNNLAKIHNARNHIYGENFKLKLCMCAQRSKGTHTKFQLEILIRSTISAIHKFRENILESLRNISETTPWLLMSPGSSTAMVLTHWGQGTYRCVSKLTIIGSDNGIVGALDT